MKRADPQTLSKIIKYYNRQDIQQAIADASIDREAVGSYGGEGYGKRPDVINYPTDVFELVKRGVTSFHTSEERWQNPLRLQLNQPKSELDNLRIGWDLVLDIDCPWWELSKLTTALFIKALKGHGIKSISVKFSGNKGFHIGVPYEAFPKKTLDTETHTLFPEGPRKIAAYLLDQISTEHIQVQEDKVNFGNIKTYTFEELCQITGKQIEDFVTRSCENCHKPYDEKWEKHHTQFVCPSCETRVETAETTQFLECQKCLEKHDRKVIMHKDEFTSHDTKRQCCQKPKPYKHFNPRSIIDVDTILIAPRHLFRAPYSYHEKSGRASLPISPDDVLTFDKETAETDRITVGKHRFLDRTEAQEDEAAALLTNALEWAKQTERKKTLSQQYAGMLNTTDEFQAITEAIPEQLFPPCMHAIFEGITDGKKRALFALVNYLTSVGWSYDQIEERLKEWNKKNPEPLREVYLLGQVRYAKTHKKKILPPNCDAKGYYTDIRVCRPDVLCRNVTNPVNYAVKKARMAQKETFAKKNQEKEKLERSEQRRKQKESTKNEKEGTDNLSEKTESVVRSDMLD